MQQHLQDLFSFDDDCSLPTPPPAVMEMIIQQFKKPAQCNPPHNEPLDC